MKCGGLGLSSSSEEALRRGLARLGLSLERVDPQKIDDSGAYGAFFLATDGAGMNLTALRRLRTNVTTVPLVLLVSGGSERFAVEAYRSGASEYLREPIDFQELAEAIERLGIC